MKRFLLYIMGALLATGCADRIPYGQNVMTVRITPAWGVDDQQPDEVMARFYRPDGTFYKEFSMPPSGDEVEVQVGDYQVIVVNTDAQQMQFGGMDWFNDAAAQLLLVTKNIEARVEHPGDLFSSVCQVEPKMNEVAEVVSPMSAHRIPLKVKLIDQGVLLSGAQKVEMILRNVADGVSLSSSEPYHTSVSTTTLVSLVDDGVEGGAYWFSGSILGCCVKEGCLNRNGHDVYVDIAVTMADGTKKNLSAAITKPILEAQKSMVRVEIEITISQVGFTAEVTRWTTGAASGDIIG